MKGRGIMLGLKSIKTGEILASRHLKYSNMFLIVIVSVGVIIALAHFSVYILDKYFSIKTGDQDAVKVY